MIRIIPGCIVCGVCEALCARVFDVRDDGAVVVAQPREADRWAVATAIMDCPVFVIEDTDE
ncbi:hypothetical protein LCGC14_2356320 [marine sediment metagenome]|uniref:4Fe-4S ferredoxin-type domain-containing protein n=1 Tax=marine sediment metagenome TaxID=412755 RepID=A0A0F9F2S0_9ZZZZ